MSRPELLLIDLGSVYWAAWHSSAEDELSAARDRTLNKVRSLVAGRDRKLVAVCCDSPKSWRKAKHPTYKANRPEKDHAAIGELALVKERLVADGLLLWEAAGFEADDVIASACKLADQHGMDVLIASADKDLLQLVSHARSVRVLSTKTGKTMLEEDVKEKLGVLPPLVRDWLALVGDTSDNVAGVPGVGPKRASELLNKYGSIEGILTAIEDPKATTPAIREALKNSLEVLAIGRELVTLSTDAPINFAELNEERAVKPLTETDYMDHGDPEEDGRNEPSAAEQAAHTAELHASAPPNDQYASAAGLDLTNPPLTKVPPAAIVRTEPAQLAPVTFEHGLEPMSINGAFKFAQGVFNSRLYPHFTNVEAIWAVMVRGREMGMGALMSLDTITMIKGRPSMSAHLIIARAKQHPDCEYFQFIEGDDKAATWECKRRGNPHPTRLTYTIEQAQAAGLANEHNWVKRRPEMIRKTCGVQLARIEFPEAAIGMYAEEELSASD